METNLLETLWPIRDKEFGVPNPNPAVVHRHEARYRKAAGMILEHSRIARRHAVWLDVACGTGYGADIIHRMAMPLFYLGVDANERVIEYARKHFGAKDGLQDGSKTLFRVFSCLDAIDALYAKGGERFDGIVSVETLEHLPQEHQQVFCDGVVSALRGAGAAVISCPVGSGEKPENPFHLYEPTPEDMYRYLGPNLKSLVFEDVLDGTYGGFTQMYALIRCRH